MSQKIRIKLKSYDHNLVDKSAEKIVKTVKSTGAVVNGPIPLPTNKRIYTVLRSPHVNKKSREQFQLSNYKRLLDIYSSSSKTIDALMKLDLAGFSVSSGSACSSGKVKESHVLKAMNISQNMREGAIRVSLGWGSNKEEVKNFISFFENLLNKTAKE